MANIDEKPIGSSGLLYLIQKIKGTFVVKETGKSLSTNDFTDTLKTKLEGIEDNANNYSLPLATNAVRGGVKVGYTTTGKNYAVQLNNEQMYVNVPWSDTTYSDATQSVHGLMSTADKTKLDAFSTADKYALKTDIASAIIYKGSVDTEADLPSSGQKVGDMYDVKSTGHNFAWNGTEWDDLGGTFSITYLTNSEIDTIWNQAMA